MGTNITGIGNANAIGFKSRVTGGTYFPPELKDALVGVWSAYGKSNDSTDRNIIKNKIKDRGGDFVISNAAFKLNSGFGKYEADFTNWVAETGTKLTSDKITNSNPTKNWIAYRLSGVEFKEMHIRILGIPDNGLLYFQRPAADGGPIRMFNGDNNIPAFTSTGICGFFIYNLTGLGWSNLVIEQIPSFEGAFVTDGIDDTIISTKTLAEMGITDEVTVVSMIHQISLNPTYNNGFTNYIENLDKSTYVRNNIYKAGKTGIYGYSASLTSRTYSDINNILGDKKDYGTEIVNRQNTLDRTKFSVVGRASSIREISSIAWYWTIIANKVLTTDQINQVIAYFNLDRTLKPDILCNTIKQGITNENHAEFGDKLIDFSGNGRDIQLNNIAWNKESGIDDNGALCLDGVNDFGKVTGMPIYKDYTIIADYERFYLEPITGGRASILSKSSKVGDGSFIFNLEDQDGGKACYTFGGANGNISDDITRIIRYQSKYYNTKTLSIGTAEDNDFMVLGKVREVDSRHFYGVIYSLMSFPYSMSEFLIERQLKKHKLGTLYPDMVEFRPIIKANDNYKIFYTALLPLTGDIWERINIGDYVPVGRRVAIQLSFDNEASELVSAISSQLGNISITKNSNNKGYTIFGDILKNKSPQKIKITIDEYIRYEDIVQPYPVLLRFNDENGNEVSWGGKFKVGSTITRIGSAADSNLLPNIYNIFGLLLNDNQVTSSKAIVEKTMVFKAKSAYIFDNNEPKCILSPRLLRIPNSSYKILGYIPDISGHGNHGKINNSAYAGASGANGYLQNFSGWTKASGVSSTDSVISSSNNLVAANGWIAYVKSGTVVPTFKVEISGIPINGNLRFEGSGQTLVNGVNTIQGLTTTKISGFHISSGYDNDWSNLRIEQVGEYEGAYCLDGVDDFVTIPTLSSGGKQVLMKVNWSSLGMPIYEQRTPGKKNFAIISNSSAVAYIEGNDGNTYIDGILNNNIKGNELVNITHNITITNELSEKPNTSPMISMNNGRNAFTKMSLYDFMLFDDISTDDKIKQLNEYVGIEAKVELPPYYWDAYGKSNLDEDRDSIKQRGVAVGNYDLTNYNHAYDKMSGYGGYAFAKFDNTTEWTTKNREDGIEIIKRNGYSFTAKRIGTGQYFYDFQNRSTTVLNKSLTVKAVSNNNTYIRWEYKYRTAEKPNVDSTLLLVRQAMTPNVSITVTLPYKTEQEKADLGVTEGSDSYLFYFDPSDIPVGDEYTVEMLPLYPNGLVYDGVDDYSKNANIPALDDFTAIIKREWLKKQGSPLIKGSKVYEGGNGNALLLEWNKAYNFVFYKRTDIMEGELPDNISFITPTNYNGNVITRGSEQDTNGICIAGDGNAGFANMVFYKLILYPKTIPLLQINFLKNLMEKDEIIDLNNPIFIKDE